LNFIENEMNPKKNLAKVIEKEIGYPTQLQFEMVLIFKILSNKCISLKYCYLQLKKINIQVQLSR